MFCGKCGVKNDGDDKFCKMCGNELLKVDEGTTEEVVQQSENVPLPITEAGQPIKKKKKIISWVLWIVCGAVGGLIGFNVIAGGFGGGTTINSDLPVGWGLENPLHPATPPTISIGNQIIIIVQNTIFQHQDRTIQEAFENFFVNVAWEYFINDYGDMFVIFNGNEVGQNNAVLTQFIFGLNEDASIIRETLLFLNDVEQTQTARNELMHLIYNTPIGAVHAYTPQQNIPSQITPLDWTTFSNDYLTISIPDSFHVLELWGGFEISGYMMTMQAGHFNRLNDYWEWLTHGSHINQFGVPINRQDFIFDDGNVGVMVEDEEGIVFLNNINFFRILYTGDRSIFANNQELIESIARTLTVGQQSSGQANSPIGNIDRELVGRWQIHPHTAQWHYEDTVFNFNADGTGYEIGGGTRWEFTWSYSYGMTLILHLVYDNGDVFELEYSVVEFGAQLYINWVGSVMDPTWNYRLIFSRIN